MCEKHNVDMGFMNEKYPAGTHMCMIYSSEEERERIIAKFIQSGISTGEKVGYFADEVSPQYVKKWLQEQGVKLPEPDESDNFNVSSASNTYHPSGTFDPEEMLNTLKIFYETAIEENYPSCRVTGEMTWALKGVPGSDRLMEYEAKLNDVLAKYPVTAICQYDSNKFDGATILDCLKVHPHMIVHGLIVENPYYMKPEDYFMQKATE